LDRKQLLKFQQISYSSDLLRAFAKNNGLGCSFDNSELFHIHGPFPGRLFSLGSHAHQASAIATALDYRYKVKELFSLQPILIVLLRRDAEVSPLYNATHEMVGSDFLQSLVGRLVSKETFFVSNLLNQKGIALMIIVPLMSSQKPGKICDSFWYEGTRKPVSTYWRGGKNP
jgi:hypothetical protein